ncbi:EAL domain-containing protein [Halomonas organivorans]|uniref:Diguanylate cyclase (GGDEF)-like protein/PAS domain S-box-containing protein n=1 Tax=Halomonas organivorans TaxID=257772 RepID=A0A7W5BWX5_9GAMM|nr:diguanylate cyclase (GGDEF)-like protein/PAS domain S-box-containing protein [Halomonas organivorans]
MTKRHVPARYRLASLALATLALSSSIQADTLRVGVYDNPPKLMLDEAGRPSGIFGDLLTTIADEEGWTLEVVPCEWQDCLTRLAAGDLDLLPDVARTEPREALLDFHDEPVLSSWSQLYQAAGADLQSMRDLAGHRIAVLEGSVQQRYLAGLARSFDITVDWQPVNGYAAGFQRVVEGRADAVVANHHYGDYRAEALGLHPTPILFQPARLFFATPEGRHGELLARLDAHLNDWKQQSDSPWFAIRRRWMAAAGSPPLIPDYLWLTLAGLGGGATLLAILSLLLRRQVRRRTRDLQANQQRLETILDSVDAGIYIKDASRRYEYVNRKVADFLGVAPADVVGRTDEDLLEARTAQQLRQHDDRVFVQGQRVANEHQVRSPGGDGEVRTFYSIKLPLATPEGRIQALCGISTDLTEYRRIQRLAHYDLLTGLPNREQLFKRLRRAMDEQPHQASESGLLLLDLDHFSTFNKTRGLNSGDRLLGQVASRLIDHLDAHASLYRPGGDEFALVLGGLSGERDIAMDRLQAAAQTLLEALSQPFDLHDGPHRLTASVGAVLLSEGKGDLSRLMKCAELALYEAKGAGRNRLRFFDPGMQTRVEYRVRREEALRQALENDQLTLHLQPQVDHQGHIGHMEALIRWAHPTEGWIPPGDFIPIAEASDLIIDVGDRVLALACQQLAAWARENRSLGLAVNISPRQFRQLDFTDKLLRLLKRHAIDPHRLELEITESLLIQDTGITLAHMTALRRHGVRFALDDFGTGYASLAYLKRLPLDRLKIDRGFVRDLLDDANDEAIVRTILALGESLGLEVIAEGVETRDQHRRLGELGCRYFQGYLFGRPAPVDAWGERLAVGDAELPR